MRVSADLVLTQIKRSIVVPAKFTPAKAREGEERELSTPQDCWGLLDRPAEPVHRAGQRPDPLALMTRWVGNAADRFSFTGIWSRCDYFAAIVRKISGNLHNQIVLFALWAMFSHDSTGDL